MHGCGKWSKQSKRTCLHIRICSSTVMFKRKSQAIGNAIVSWWHGFELHWGHTCIVSSRIPVASYQRRKKVIGDAPLLGAKHYMALSLRTDCCTFGPHWPSAVNRIRPQLCAFSTFKPFLDVHVPCRLTGPSPRTSIVFDIGWRDLKTHKTKVELGDIFWKSYISKSFTNVLKQYALLHQVF